MTSAFSWQNSISLCPASFHIPRSNLLVTPGVSWLPTFAFQSPIMKGHLFCVLVLKGLIGLHRTIQLQLLHHYWLGHRLGSLWYWMVCLGNEQRSFCTFWDCIQHELLIAKFRLTLNKVGKTTRPFRYDLNQIPYDYTVEVRNRFQGLDLIDRVPDELWTEVRDIVQGAEIKTIPMKKKCKKSKMAIWGSPTNSCEKKRSEKQRRKGKI